MRNFELLVAELAEVNPEGREEVTFPIGQELDLSICLEDPTTIGLYALVHQCEGEVPKWMFEEVCLANYGCAATRGSTLGIHHLTGGVLLTRFLPFQDVAELKEVVKLVSEFIDTARLWKNRLSRPRDESPEPMEQEEPPQAEAYHPRTHLFDFKA